MQNNKCSQNCPSLNAVLPITPWVFIQITWYKMLHKAILEHDPNAIVQVITAWPREPWTTLTDRVRKKIDTYPLTKEERDKGCNSYLLFDNTQDTYWDGELWDYFFKDVVQRRSGGPCAILFCSYGSPMDRPVEHDNGTPLDLPNIACVSLTPHPTVPTTLTQ